MILWIDDLRNPNQYNISNCLWLKNFNSAKKALLTHQSEIEEIHLDNDLGESEPNREGRDLFNILESMLYNGDMKKLKKIFIHTSNSSASRSMMTAKKIFLEKYNIIIKQNFY